MHYRDRHAIITGGSSGIGLATASALAAKGARVSLLARRPGPLGQAAESLREQGARVQIRAVDVSVRSDLHAAIAELCDEAGPCDLLVSCAGIAHPGYFGRIDHAIYREQMEVNYFGTLHAIEAVVPSMIDRRCGRIVGVSSAAGLLGVFGYSAYAPSKFAVRGLLECLRAELRPHGVGVHCVYSGDVDTPQLAHENSIKPAECKAISGTVKTLSAEQVAASILRGIERSRFAIVPDVQTRVLVRLLSLLEGSLNRSFDRTVERVRRERS